MDNRPPSLESLQREVSELTATYHGRSWTTEATDLESAMTTAGNRILAAGTGSDATTITLEELAACVKTWMQAKSWIVAEDLATLVLDSCKSLKGEQDFMTMTAMHNLASAYWGRGHLDQAAALSARVTKLRQKTLGETHPQTLTSMTNLACTYRSQGLWLDAQKLDARIVELKRNTIGPRHPSTLGSMSNLAISYANLGRYQEAESISRKLVEIGERELFPTDASLLNWKLTLASTYRDQGRLDSAEQLEREVVAVSRDIFGTAHPFTLTSMANLASTCREQARWSDAERLEKEVVASSEAVLGETHPQTLMSISNLASTYRNQGRLEEAKDLGGKAIAGMKEVLGERHPHTLVAMVDLAVTYQMMRKSPDAEILAAQSLRLMEETIGKDHPHTLSAMANLGFIYQSQSKWEIASRMAETKSPRSERVTEQSTRSTFSAFSLDPEKLSDLVQSKDLQKFHSLGGIKGLEEGLRTDIRTGLSLDETCLGAASTTSTAPIENTTAAELSIPTELCYDVFVDRKKFFGDNRLPTKPSPSFLSLMWAAYNDHVLFLLTGAAVISLALGLYQTFETKHTADDPPVEWVEGVAILVAIIVITLAGAANDFQKEHKFRKLNKKQQDRNVWVLRSARVDEVPISEVVVGDVVHISPGDIVPADGVLIWGHQVKCDESSATGESDPVAKSAVETALPKDSHEIDPFILSHTKIVEGVGAYLVLATGTKSSYGRILLSLDTDPGFTPLQVRLSNLAKNIARFGALAALVLFVILFIKFCVGLRNSTESASERGQTFLNVFILALTVVVIAVPEGLPLAVTLALSFATTRMMRDNNLVRQLRACETMGQATDICSDKTGTLTQNEMTVVSGFFGATLQYTDRASSPIFFDEDKFSSVAKCMSRFSGQSKSLLRQSIAINSTAIESQYDGGREFLGSQTEAALLRFSRDYLELGQLDFDRASADVVGLLPFDTSRKYMITVVKLASGLYRSYVKGAPEILLEKCTATVVQPMQGLSTAPVREDCIDEIRQAISQYASRSLRTIAICFRDVEFLPFRREEETVDFEELVKGLTFQGILGLRDPLRAEALGAVETSHKAGVAVRMVTGDNLLTARAIAEECGIISSPNDLVMEGDKFRMLDESQQRELVPRLKVLARSRPDDKRVLVQRLKDLGRIVAVTGDGTNDAPALAAADVGFSMGISGTEIAREASSIVLMDDTFSSIVKAIMWGRAVNDAVKKFLQFQITITFTSVGLAFVSAVANSSQESVLTPVQLMWVNLFQDTLAALALATDPPPRRILDRKPEPISTPLITPTMWKMIIGQSVYQMIVTLVLYFAGSSIFSYKNTIQTSQLHTAVFNTYVWMQIFNMYNNRQVERSFNLVEGIHHNWLFIAITSVMMGAQILIMFVGGRAFSITQLTGDQWAYSIVLGAISIPIGFLLQAIPTAVVEKPMTGCGRLRDRLRGR
ncbi:hypothetical protein PDIDSM_8761 [Penicillium digitatum]|nr:hypothetical protein PDIDSM_8761 [Penicillium digitatum]